MMRDEAPPAFQGRGAGGLRQLPSRPARLRRRRRRLPPREETTLVCLIKSLVERKVVVELRNDILLRGRLDDVDDFLNMSLSEVTFQTVDGYKTEYESMYVKGRNVRFVHLPRSVDPAKAIEAYRHKVIRAKLEAARERARALGSAKPTPKGGDALAAEATAVDASGSTGVALEEILVGAGDDDGEGYDGTGGEGAAGVGGGEDEDVGEEDWEQHHEEDQQEEEEEWEGAGAALRRLDPRAAARGPAGGEVTTGPADEAGFALFLG